MKRWSFALLVCTFTAVHALPFMMFGAYPLGYDTGFYRRYLILPFVSFPNTPVPGLDHTILLPRLALDLLRMMHLSVDITLYGSYLLWIGLSVLALWLLVKQILGARTAYIVAFLFLISPVEYTGYWFMLYKHFFSLPLFLLVLYLLETKRIRYALLIALLIPLAHQTATIMLLLSLGIYVAHSIYRERRFMLEHFALVFFTLAEYLLIHPTVAQKIAAPPVAVFMDGKTFLLYMLPLLPFVIFGLKKSWMFFRLHPATASFAIVSICWVLLRLPYYERLFLYTDITIIILAGIGIDALLVEHGTAMISNTKTRLILALLLLASVCVLMVAIERNKPLVAPLFMEQIISAKEKIPRDASVLTSARLAPWVSGWIASRVYAPGIFRDPHIPPEWERYFSQESPDVSAAFLASFPKPLFIIIDSPDEKRRFVPSGACVHEVSPILYAYACAK